MSSPFAVQQQQSSSTSRREAKSGFGASITSHTNSPVSFASPPRQQGARMQPNLSGSASTSASTPALGGNGIPSHPIIDPSAADLVSNMVAAAAAVGTSSGAGSEEAAFEGIINSTRTLQQLLVQLEVAGQTFLSQYNGALSAAGAGPGQGASCEAVTESLERVLESIEGALRYSSRHGLAAVEVQLPSSASTTSPSGTNITASNNNSNNNTTSSNGNNRAESIEQRCERLSHEARDTFERRERLRESAGVVRAILSKGTG